MGSKEVLSMLLLFVQCVLITRGVFFPDKEGVRVSKYVSAVSYYMAISLSYLNSSLKTPFFMWIVFSHC